jgi:hypothetical protein
MGVGCKAAHVDTDLGEDRSRAEILDARDRDYLFDGGAKGRNAGLHLLVDIGDGGIEGVDLLEMKAQQEAMVPGHAAAQGLAQGLL